MTDPKEILRNLPLEQRKSILIVSRNKLNVSVIGRDEFRQFQELGLMERVGRAERLTQLGRDVVAAGVVVRKKKRRPLA